jgi:branched-subunit amino acid aminotransferase/4-amino-4-deoxychorismate lyase
MALRQAVAHTGATEAVIFSPDGMLVEGAYSSLMVWPAEQDGLWIVPMDPPRLRSVTEQVLLDIAQTRGIPVTEHPMTPTDLEGSEVWIVSALHGIRSAQAFIGGPTLSPQPSRAQQWQAAWWNSRRTF